MLKNSARAGDMAQVVDPRKHEALSSKPSTMKKINKCTCIYVCK
jgi:hypothetical protein